MSKVIEFFWDPGSPYTYVASTQIEQLADDCGATINWRPFLIGAVFKATGNQPGVAVAAKGKHMVVDLQRWSQHLGIPFTMPKKFPLNSVLACRSAIASGDDGDKAAKALMNAYWGKGRDVSDPEVVTQVLTDAGLDGEKLVDATQDQAVKDRLRENTDEAIERGAFGAPTFFVGDAMFWGNDRLPLLRDYINGKIDV